MTLFLLPLQKFITTFYIISLCQISLALALPANNVHLSSTSLSARDDVALPNLSGVAGKIAGLGFALVVLSLGFGLGAASIAILGSTEWREFRDRKKPKVPAKDGPVTTKPPQQPQDEEKGVNRVDTGLTESTVDEKEKTIQAPERRTRLTLKSFMPIDFGDLKPGWLTDHNKT